MTVVDLTADIPHNPAMEDIAEKLGWDEAVAAIQTKGEMGGEELLACRRILGWRARYLADRIGVDEGSIRQWQRGRRGPPPPVAAWLRRVAGLMASNPPPAAPAAAPGAARGRGRPLGSLNRPAGGLAGMNRGAAG